MQALGLALAIAPLAALADAAPPAAEAPRAAAAPFQMQVLATGLANPHNMVLGPDGHLWVTELFARRILRVNTATGAITVLAEVGDAVHSRPGGGHAQDGLLVSPCIQT